MRSRLVLGGLGALVLVLVLLAGCARAAPDACGTCTTSPTAICDQGVCRPRLPERPDPHIESSEHEVATLPYEYVASWPEANAVAGHFVQTLLSGAGIPHHASTRRSWQEVAVPEPLAPRARNLLDVAVESGQPGRRAAGSIPSDSPPHLAFKVLERR